MRALLLNSILIATVLIPVRASRDPGAGRGLRRALIHMVLFNLVYALACAYLYGHLP